MKNIKKNKLVKIFFICIIILIVSNFIMLILINVNQDRNKNNTISLVKNNIKLLNESVENKTYDKIYELEEIKDIIQYSLDDNGLYIDFFCHGYGFASSSIYTGFYYVSEDKPTGFQAATYKLEYDGEAWKWKQPNGDNWYYTEKIFDNWYYYEAGF